MGAQNQSLPCIFKCRVASIAGPAISVAAANGGYVWYPEGPSASGTNVTFTRSGAGVVAIVFPRALSLLEDTVLCLPEGTGASPFTGGYDVAFSGGSSPAFTTITVRTFSQTTVPAIAALDTSFQLVVFRSPGVSG